MTPEEIEFTRWLIERDTYTSRELAAKLVEKEKPVIREVKQEVVGNSTSIPDWFLLGILILFTLGILILAKYLLG